MEGWSCVQVRPSVDLMMPTPVMEGLLIYSKSIDLSFHLFIYFNFNNWSIIDLNVVLVSGVQQSEPVIHIHISTLF